MFSKVYRFSKVYIVVLNYNTWQDTIECLESVYKNYYDNYQVILVDNHSDNNSVEFLKMWAEGRLDIFLNDSNALKSKSFPPVKKPIAYKFYNENEINKDNCVGEINEAGNPRLIIIESNANRGFASGNNIALKYALFRNDFEYIWLLNNDTVIDGDSLAELVETADRHIKNANKTGVIGSKILSYDKPKLIQGAGAKYNKWLGTAKYIGLNEKDLGQFDEESIIRKADYVVGASMFVSKDFVADTGLLCEDYFLYFEELDWILRGKKRGWNIGYCWKSKVYHKEGATIGSNADGKRRSELSDYYIFKSRIIFTKRFYPNFIWTIYAGFIGIALNRIKRKQFKRLKMIWSIIKTT